MTQTGPFFERHECAPTLHLEIELHYCENGSITSCDRATHIPANSGGVRVARLVFPLPEPDHVGDSESDRQLQMRTFPGVRIYVRDLKLMCLPVAGSAILSILAAVPPAQLQSCRKPTVLVPGGRQASRHAAQSTDVESKLSFSAPRTCVRRATV